MKHYGDITKLNGAELPIVDVITGGSPCQDISIAGKRDGLAGARSGLFMEQIRIVKEMREHDRASGRADELIRPRYMVWENVPGAFSSNNGEDFRRVLEEVTRIAEPDTIIPRPAGKWRDAGIILGRGWSIAWRVHDAQFWGVPQRRKRIALVADFGGQSAPEILFECESVRGDFKEGREAGEEVAGAIRESIDKTSKIRGVTAGFKYKASGTAGSTGYEEEIAPSLMAGQESGVLCENPRQMVYGISAYESNAMKSDNPYSGVYEASTSRTLDLNGGNPVCNQGGMIILEGNGSRPSHRGDGYRESETCYTLNATEVHAVYDARGNGDGNITPTITGDHNAHVSDYTAICIGNGQAHIASHLTEEVSQTLNCMHDPMAVMVTAVDCRNGTENGEINGTLQAKEQGQNLNSNNVCRQGQVVRRLTPLECERLQGFPDGWTDIGDWTDSNGKLHKAADSPRYKVLGNSIALPFWQWMAERICKQYDRRVTMGSLFDGIGGFPLVFSRCGATPVWASEIEEFPIAVTKKHFPDSEG